jgi:hypothetical protein
LVRVLSTGHNCTPFCYRLYPNSISEIVLLEVVGHVKGHSGFYKGESAIDNYHENLGYVASKIEVNATWHSRAALSYPDGSIDRDWPD